MREQLRELVILSQLYLMQSAPLRLREKVAEPSPIVPSPPRRLPYQKTPAPAPSAPKRPTPAPSLPDGELRKMVASYCPEVALLEQSADVVIFCKELQEQERLFWEKVAKAIEDHFSKRVEIVTALVETSAPLLLVEEGISFKPSAGCREIQVKSAALYLQSKEEKRQLWQLLCSYYGR